jgi:hypothetical protein
MFKAQALSSFSSMKGASLFKKKFIVLFIFLCMSVNGFIPNRADVNKYSFVVIFAHISQSAAVQLLSKCGNSIMSVTSKICTEIAGVIMPSAEAEAAAGSEKKQKEDNTSADYALIANAAPSVVKRTAIHDDTHKAPLFFTSLNGLLKIYGSSKSSDSCPPGAGLFILFIVFIAAIRQRKGLAEEAIMEFNIEAGKTRISA